MHRRNFLAGAVRSALFATLGKSLAAETVVASASPSSPSGLAADPRRPRFHLLPAANWMNDPNAPIYFNGHYHLFYQYNPNGAYWGDIHWGHAISADMVHWKHLPVALAPTPSGPDADGCFSGTAVIDDGKVTILYTGVRKASFDRATIKDDGHLLRETQCLATSDDPELKSWSKSPAPVIAQPPPGMQVNGFRDPSPWRQGDWWYMVLGSGIANQGGAVLLYRSKDLRTWEYLSIFAARNQNGAHTFDPFDPWEVWECPEFFPLGGKHLLIYSSNGKTFWQSGVLDAEKMAFSPERSGILDHGSFYAPKTQLDKSLNRILWGWVPETRPEKDAKAAGWAGLMSLPRALTLRNDGLLNIGIAAEVIALRTRERMLDIAGDENKNLRQIDSLRIEGCCGEVLCKARRTAEPFHLSLCAAKDSNPKSVDWIDFAYDPLHASQISIDGRPMPLHLEKDEPLEIHLYVDGSVIEAFVNQQVACTKRFYYAGGSDRDVRLKWEGKTAPIERLSLWQLSPASADRLTT